MHEPVNQELTDSVLLKAVENMPDTPSAMSICAIPGAVPGFSKVQMPHHDSEEDDGGHVVKRSRCVHAGQVTPRHLTYDSITPTEVQVSEPEEGQPRMLAIIDQQTEDHGALGMCVSSAEGARLPGDEVEGAEEHSCTLSPTPAVSTDENEDDHEVAEEMVEGAVDDQIATSGCPFFAHLAVSPQDLLQNKTVVVNRITQCVSAYAVSDDATVGMLKTVESQMMHVDETQIQVFNAVGVELDDVDLVVNTQIVVLMHQTQPKPSLGPAYEGFLANMPRALSVLCQGGGVADDEMRYYMSAFISQSVAHVVDPIVLDNFEDCELRCQSWLHELTQSSEVPNVSMLLANQHWIPCVVLPEEPRTIITTDEGARLLSGMLQADCRSVGSLAQVFVHDCGFQAFAWMAHQLKVCDMYAIMSFDTAASWRYLFWQHLLLHGRGSEQRWHHVGGHGDDLSVAIATLLREHGVAPGKAPSRAQEVIATLGQEALKRALLGPRPWPQIKAIANRCVPAYKLILPDELAEVVRERQAKGESLGRNSRKQKPKVPPARVDQHVCPGDIHIPTGVFEDDKGSPVQQIEPKQFNHVRHGVVVIDEVESKPYVQQGSGNMTTEGLLFLVVNPSADCIRQHGEPLRFPAQCKFTGEPILLSAVAIQMGQKHIRRARPAMIPTMPEVQVITVKMMVFRDQVDIPWHKVVAAHFKHVLFQVPCLAVCRKKQCGCEGWHKDASSTETEPLLDVWNHEYLTLQFKRTKPEDADMYSCSARVRADLFPKLRQAAAVNGFYMEPRTPDGRRQHEEFHTVWLPKMVHAEAVAACARSPQQAFVIRVQKRYGLKVARKHGEEVHKLFHQDSPFLGAAGLKLFQLGPLPWGTTRGILQKQLSEWQWSAVPLHPIGQAECRKGLMWLVKAPNEPQCSVITMSHGDVIIVPRDVAQSQAPVIPKVEASQLTKRTLQKQEQELLSDPWAQAASKLPQNKSGMDVVSQSQFRQLEERLNAKIAACSGQTGGEDQEMTTDYEPRFKAMESQIQQLQLAQQQQMVTTQEIKAQVDTQGQLFQQHLDQRMNEQLERIDAMLKKRGRDE